jgi:hypothetical protein
MRACRSVEKKIGAWISCFLQLLCSNKDGNREHRLTVGFLWLLCFRVITVRTERRVVPAQSSLLVQFYSVVYQCFRHDNY